MSDLTAKLTAENAREPFRRLLVRVDQLSLTGRHFLVNLPELKDSLEAISGAIDVASRMSDGDSDDDSR